MALGNVALALWLPAHERATVLQISRAFEPALAVAEADARWVIVAVGSVSIAFSLILLRLESRFAARHTAQLAAEAKIRFLAFHDPLTGLLNRACFHDLFAEQLHTTASLGGLVALHLVDLDRFKAVNDVHGHAAGDDVIRIAAKRLQMIAGDGNLVGRIGGDEFVIAQCTACDADDVRRMAGTIVAAMAQPFVSGARQFVLSASVGVRLCHGAREDMTIIYKAADKALYKAKQHGRDGFAIYDDALDKALSDRDRIEHRLRAMAADADEVTVVYQPLCNVTYGEVKGFEALLRMSSCPEGAVPADLFVSIAEELGLIAEIGAHVLNRALRFAMSLPDHLTIAVNVSPQQFLVSDPALSIVEVTRRALAASGLAPGRLELEITEGLFLQATDHVKQQLQGLKTLGVTIALDDFGVGYCSLAYLSRFPVDKLKIDKSFLSDALARPDRLMPILESIATLGQKLGLTVVAEGIETPEQAEIAERVGCQQLQGYYFCRPIDEVDVAAYLACNTLGTKALKLSDATNGIDRGVSFWSRLSWTETSGTWARAKAAAS